MRQMAEIVISCETLPPEIESIHSRDEHTACIQIPSQTISSSQLLTTPISCLPPGSINSALPNSVFLLNVKKMPGTHLPLSLSLSLCLFLLNNRKCFVNILLNYIRIRKLLNGCGLSSLDSRYFHINKICHTSN